MTHSNNSLMDQLQAPAALVEARAKAAREREIATLCNLESRRGERVLQVIDLGDGDALVQATVFDGYWAVVVDNVHAKQWLKTKDEALVHLVAVRHGGRNTQATGYALRVLNVPTDD